MLLTNYFELTFFNEVTQTNKQKRGMCSKDAIDIMEEASKKLDEVIELLNYIM